MMMIVNLLQGIQRWRGPTARMVLQQARYAPELVLRDRDGTVLGSVTRPVGTPSFGTNAPALLLQRDF